MVFYSCSYCIYISAQKFQFCGIPWVLYWPLAFITCPIINSLCNCNNYLKKNGVRISWPFVMYGVTIIALILSIGGLYGKNHTLARATTYNQPESQSINLDTILNSSNSPNTERMMGAKDNAQTLAPYTGKHHSITETPPNQQTMRGKQIESESVEGLAISRQPAEKFISINYNSKKDRKCWSQYQQTISSVPENAPLGEFSRINDMATERLGKCIN